MSQFTPEHIVSIMNDIASAKIGHEVKVDIETLHQECFESDTIYSARVNDLGGIFRCVVCFTCDESTGIVERAWHVVCAVC